MSLVQAFNTLLSQFVDELARTFPNDKKIGMYSTLVRTMCRGETAMALDAFHSAVKPFEAQIMAKDETLINLCPDMLGDIDIKGLWGSGLTAKNKEVFWEYLQALLLVARQVPNAGASSGSSPAALVKSLPPGVVAAIEGVDMTDLMSIAEDLDQDEVKAIMNGIDPAELTSLMTNFSPDKIAKLADKVDKQKILSLVSKVDKNKLMRVASKVDQKALLGLLEGTSKASKKKRHR
jgi:hypothetical protein